MGYGVINVWVREPDDCSISKSMNGIAWAKPCCDKETIYQESLVEGHAEIRVPPGCYIVDAGWPPGCCGYAKETVAIVGCNETVCVNLIREYTGDPYRRMVAFSVHGRQAGISEKDIETLMRNMEKIAGTVPEGKVRKYTEKEFDILEKVSDKEHKAILNKYRTLLVKKKTT